MIIETKADQTNNKCLIDDNSIMAVEDMGARGTSLLLYGIPIPVVVQTPFNEMEKIFIEIKERDRFTGEAKRKSEYKKFGDAVVGIHKFRLDIQTTEYEDGAISNIRLHANFPVKNETLQSIVENVTGVEKYSNWYGKYEAGISIGKLFDAEIVRDSISTAIFEFLNPQYNSAI